MRKKIALCLLLALLLTGCSTPADTEETPKDQPEADGPLTVTVEGTGELHPPSQEDEEHPSVSLAEPDGPAVPQGGTLAVSGQQAVFLTQDGGIALADLESGTYRYLSEMGAATLYYDGEQTFCTGDEGIFAIDSAGEVTQLSEVLSYRLWLQGEKIYYIRQIDLSVETPAGELWCMEKDGSSAVMILPTELFGSFCIKDGWIYYVSRTDGALYRTMLYGTETVKLADGPVEICFVTDRGVYYKEQSGRQTLRRIDLKSGANISLGAYGEIVAAGEQICLMARREGVSGNLDNRFTLMVFDDRTQELNELLVFENVGADSLLWQQGDYVYMRMEDHGVYRMALDDAEQTKELIFPLDTVFSGGKAFYTDGAQLMVYDCETLETAAVSLE